MKGPSFNEVKWAFSSSSQCPVTGHDGRSSSKCLRAFPGPCPDTAGGLHLVRAMRTACQFLPGFLCATRGGEKHDASPSSPILGRDEELVFSIRILVIRKFVD